MSYYLSLNILTEALLIIFSPLNTRHRPLSKGIFRIVGSFLYCTYFMLKIPFLTKVTEGFSEFVSNHKSIFRQQ